MTITFDDIADLPTPEPASWPGRVALTRIDPEDLSPTRRAQIAAEGEAAGPWYLTRYAYAYALNGHVVTVRWNGAEHEFDRGTGLCVATPWGLLGDWRIAPEEMPRFRGLWPQAWGKVLATAAKERRFPSEGVAVLARRVYDRGEYAALGEIVGGFWPDHPLANGLLPADASADAVLASTPLTSAPPDVEPPAKTGKILRYGLQRTKPAPSAKGAPKPAKRPSKARAAKR